MRGVLRIGQRQRADPGAAGHQPALDAEMLAQGFDIGQQVGGGVGGEIGCRITRRGCAAAALALVQQHDVVGGGIKIPAVSGAAARARPAMQHQRRFALRIAAAFPIQVVSIGGSEHAMGIGFDGRVHARSSAAHAQKNEGANLGASSNWLVSTRGE
jgi:hypothetical protein